jgi:hypothetical protein
VRAVPVLGWHADATELAIIQADIDLFTSGMAAAQKKSDDDVADLKTSNANLQKEDR